MTILHLVTAAANVLRDNHYVKNNATGLYERCLLLERAGANGITTYSTDTSQVGWGKFGVLTPTMTATGPDGVANSACRIIQDTGTGGHYQYHWQTFAAGAVQSASCWLRAVGAQRYVRVNYQSTPSTNQCGVTLDLTTGAVTAWVAGTGTVMFARAVGPANGLWRVMFAGVVDATSTAGAFSFQLLSPDGSTATFTGDGVSGVDMFNAQLELGVAVPTSDMPSGASAGTRAVDLASLDLTGTALATPGPCTGYMKYIYLGSTSATPFWHPWALAVPSSAGQNALLVFVNGSGQPSCRWWNGTSTFVDAGGSSMPVPAIGDQVEVWGSVDEAGVPHCAMAVNGGAPVTANGATGLPFQPAWASPTVYLNAADGAGASAGRLALQAFGIAPGAPGLEAMSNAMSEG